MTIRWFKDLFSLTTICLYAYLIVDIIYRYEFDKVDLFILAFCSMLMVTILDTIHKKKEKRETPNG